MPISPFTSLLRASICSVLCCLKQFPWILRHTKYGWHEFVFFGCVCLCDYYDVPVLVLFFVVDFQVHLQHESLLYVYFCRCRRHRRRCSSDKHVKICLMLLSTEAQAIHESNSIISNTQTHYHSNNSSKNKTKKMFNVPERNENGKTILNTHAFSMMVGGGVVLSFLLTAVVIACAWENYMCLTLTRMIWKRQSK